MSLELVALTSDFLGKILIGTTALLVHRRIKKEKRIDMIVLREMKFEQVIGFFGIVLITIAYSVNLYLL